ncbi:MAG: AN1-type zinc finger domain-containing protein [Candidatus Hydrothermarchaeales archaeon]
MASCIVCGKKELLPFKCKFCGNIFCSEHRLPENHQCVGLEMYKEESRTKPGKWVYEPFQDRVEEVERRRKEPIIEKIERFLRNLDKRQVIWIIIVLIILLTIFESIR